MVIYGQSTAAWHVTIVSRIELNLYRDFRYLQVISQCWHIWSCTTRREVSTQCFKMSIKMIVVFSRFFTMAFATTILLAQSLSNSAWFWSLYTVQVMMTLPVVNTEMSMTTCHGSAYNHNFFRSQLIPRCIESALFRMGLSMHRRYHLLYRRRDSKICYSQLSELEDCSIYYGKQCVSMFRLRWSQKHDFVVIDAYLSIYWYDVDDCLCVIF